MQSSLPPASLLDLGWDDGWADLFAAEAPPETVPGRIVAEHTHLYRVRTATDERLALVPGRLRHRAVGRTDFPVVGDWVAVTLPPASGRASIRAVLARRSRFSRKSAGNRTDEQVVAANIDMVFVVTSLDGDFNPRRLERYVIVTRESGAVPVIVLNKADRCDDVSARLAEAATVAPDVEVHAVSAKAGEGLDALRPHFVRGRTVACLGSSGVGKSTLINALLGEMRLPTRDVRDSDRRGRHASSFRQLVVLPGGGLVIDTPGMRELQVWEAGPGLLETFDDIKALSAGCRFRDCGHRGEPGCAVRAASDEGHLPKGRLENYLKLGDELASLAARQDERARAERKRADRVLHRAARRHQPRR